MFKSNMYQLTSLVVTFLARSCFTSNEGISLPKHGSLYLYYVHTSTSTLARRDAGPDPCQGTALAPVHTAMFPTAAVAHLVRLWVESRGVLLNN